MTTRLSLQIERPGFHLHGARGLTDCGLPASSGRTFEMLAPLRWLRRHPLPVRAFFRHSLVLCYALPSDVLAPLLPPGLVLDEHRGFGFVAIAMVQTESLRPTFLPEFLGQDFFLSGYRIFARFKTASGRTLRGLRILRSDTDRRVMAFVGYCLTHYNYRLARVNLRVTAQRLEVEIRTPKAEADLRVVADLSTRPAPLPAGSPFAGVREARLFAGPLPFTFDYEEATHSIVIIEGVRESWKPVPIKVDVQKCTFFDHSAFTGAVPILANAFHVENVPYSWKCGRRQSLL